MLHLRLVSPADRTPEVLRRLKEHPAVTNVAAVPGGAVQPAGDLVLCDVAREATSEVIEALRDLDLEHAGSMALETVDTVISEAADAAVDAAPGSPADSVVWEEVEAKTDEDSHLTVTFFAFLVIAVHIAAVGIVLDAPILLVGAMVVGPEFGPLAGVSVAVVQRRAREAVTSLTALVAGFPAAIALVTASSLALRAAGWFPADIDLAHRPLTGFISDPTLLSLLVALLAGVAGTLSLTSAKSSALVGVLISVTTVPAAANVGVAAAFGDLRQAAGAAAQLVVNLVGLSAAGVATLGLQRLVFLRRRARAARAVRP